MKLNKLPFLFLAALLINLSACKKEIEETITDTSQVADTITVGKPLTLSPDANNGSKVTYNWTVNGKTESTSKDYTFSPTERGDYELKFTTLKSGQSIGEKVYKIHVYAKYENGFFIINEGWYGHGTGDVSFYRYDTKRKEDSLFIKENPDKTLDPATSTLQSGVFFGDDLYLVAKVGGPMIITDRLTLKEKRRIPAKVGIDWYSFVGVSSEKGFLSSSKGLFPLNLTTLTPGDKLPGITNSVGDLLKVDNYVFALVQSKGIVIINATTNAIEKTISGVTVGFTRSKDGSIWAAGGNKLFRINPATLEVETVTVPFNIPNSWMAWTPGAITSSTRENAIFFVRNTGGFNSVKEVYKYIPGNDASLTTPFIIVPTNRAIYGSGIAYREKSDELIVNLIQTGQGQNYKINDMIFYNASTGAVKNTYGYEGFYFPSIILFQK